MHNNGKIDTSKYREELKYRILRAAMPMFKQRGIKAVRMDDIAARLSISKRTLYEIYDNKEDLLLECVRLDSDEFQKRLQDYAMEAENELDIVVAFFRMKLADLESLSADFLGELEKYPQVTAFFRERHERQREQSAGFLRKCVENGDFIPDINFDTIQDISDRFMASGMVISMLDRHSLRDIFCNFFIVMLRGMCTEKGLEMIDRYLG